MAGFTGFRGKTFPALTSKLALAEQSRGGDLGALRRSGTPLAIVFSKRPPRQLPRHFTRVNRRISPAMPSPQIPPTLFRRSGPRPASTGFRPFRHPSTSQDHAPPPPPFRQFLKISAHSRALVDSSDSQLWASPPVLPPADRPPRPFRTGYTALRSR